MPRDMNKDAGNGGHPHLGSGNKAPNARGEAGATLADYLLGRVGRLLITGIVRSEVGIYIEGHLGRCRARCNDTTLLGYIAIALGIYVGK